jgi:hypothetical protein
MSNDVGRSGSAPLLQASMAPLAQAAGATKQEAQEDGGLGQTAFAAADEGAKGARDAGECGDADDSKDGPPFRGYWEEPEEQALRDAVQKHGIGAWEKMRHDSEFKALE